MNRTKIAQFAIIVTLFLLGATPMLEASLGQSINLQWDANTEPDVAGYKVHYGTAPRIYSDTVIAGNVTGYLLPHLFDGQTYYVAVTAYDNFGNESGYSNEIANMPGKPGQFRAWRQAINDLWRELKEVVFNS